MAAIVVLHVAPWAVAAAPGYGALAPTLLDADRQSWEVIGVSATSTVHKGFASSCSGVVVILADSCSTAPGDWWELTHMWGCKAEWCI